MENLQMVPSEKNVEAQYVEMIVPLYSYGCERKMKKALAKLKGIYSVNVDRHQQKVTVWGICDKYDILSMVQSKRKGARFWNEEDNSLQLQKSHSSPQPSFSNYQSMIKNQSLNLNLAIIKGRSLNWKALKKAFKRSISF